jgi:hypothetical protein
VNDLEHDEDCPEVLICVCRSLGTLPRLSHVVVRRRGRYGLSLTDYGIVVTGDFFLILNKVGTTGSLDNGLVSPPPDRSFIGDSLPGLVPLFPPDHNNFLLRVDVDPISPAAVGGIVTPVNTFVIFAPWLAVIGVVACIGTVVVVAKKRRQ